MKEAVAMAAKQEAMTVAALEAMVPLAWAMALTCGRRQGSGPSAEDVPSLACSVMLSCKGA